MTTQSKIKNPKPVLSAAEVSKIGLLSLVSLGPGDFQQMTIAAKTALQAANVVIGYQVYIDFVRPLLGPKQEIIVSPIGSEIERGQQAIELATAGRHVALISSGDIGIYAMASPVFELLRQQHDNGPEVEVYPGVSAIQAAAARLGAPLGHDFCTISLSDLLTPWPVIERRLQAAAWGDFVIGFYNPRSKKRDWQLKRAIEILLAHRSKKIPVAVIRNITREDEQVRLTSLGELDPDQVDMFTLVLVGNSQSYTMGQRIVTPRGYTKKVRKSTQKKTESLLPPYTPSHLPGSDVYPVTLTKMAGIRATVIGGGPVGQRKTQGLLNAGAKVYLISPAATPQLQAWVDDGQLDWQRRPYQSGDLKGSQLVFAATNQRTVNAQISEEARELGLLCNVADRPDEGNFHVPAVHREPELVVSVSTAGKNPGRARAIRNRIADWLDKTSK